jgi:glycosyltransferase involved in cell wall biosynthesis
MRDTTTPSENSSANAANSPPAASEKRVDTAGVVMHADIDGSSDFATENRALALRLAERHFPLQIAPAGGHHAQSSNPSRQALPRDLRYLRHDRLDLAASVLYQSGTPNAWNLDFYGRCRVGRAAFGTDRIPDGWAERCNALDELWLPSEFHRETFAASGVERTKIRVIPQAIDSEIFHPGIPSLRVPNLPAKSVQFVATADGMLASGIDILVRAFIEEFTPNEDVVLVLYCPPKRYADSYVDFEAEVIALIEVNLGRDLEDVPPIALLLGFLSDTERASLFSASHAFVHPARADATGRHCLEALASQLPVIATDWGPLNDFLSGDNSFPLDTEGAVPAQSEEDELVAGHRWAEPNVDHLRHQMREVFSHPDEGARRAEQGRRAVIDRFEWNAVLPEWIRNFRRLLD